MSRRVLITGGSGFIGANLARALLRDGNDVHLLLRRGHQPWRVTEVSAYVQMHELDLEDRESVQNAVRTVRPERVFHLAAYGAYSRQADSPKMVMTNLLGTMALLDACAETGLEAFINCGSSSEYGLKDHAAAEDEVVQPNSSYAVTKAAATHYCQFVARSRSLNAISLRLYSVYGEYEEPDRLIPALIVYGLQGCLPPLVGASTARDFVYVGDAVDAIRTVANTPSLPAGSVYNVCSGNQTRLDQLVALTRDLLQITVEPAWASMPQRTWDTDVWVGSAAKLQRDAGWRAKTDLRAGLSRTIEWFKSKPEWLQIYRDRVYPDQV